MQEARYIDLTDVATSIELFVKKRNGSYAPHTFLERKPCIGGHISSLKRQNARYDLKIVFHSVVQFSKQGLPLPYFVPCDEPELELIHYDPRQFLQYLYLVVFDGARVSVDDAQGSEVEAIMRS